MEALAKKIARALFSCGSAMMGLWGKGDKGSNEADAVKQALVAMASAGLAWPFQRTGRWRQATDQNVTVTSPATTTGTMTHGGIERRNLGTLEPRPPKTAGRDRKRDKRPAFFSGPRQLQRTGWYKDNPPVNTYRPEGVSSGNVRVW
jgi:hypothetical protein